MVSYGGTDHYLGHDKAAAQREYARHLAAWADLRARRASAPSSANRTILELAQVFLGIVLTDAGEPAERYYRKHLARFLNLWGAVKAREVRPPEVHPADWLEALKADMTRAGYAPRTILHDLNAAKRLLAWAGDRGHLPALSLRSVRAPALGVLRRIDKRPAEVAAFIDSCKRDPRLEPWLRLQFLAALRPKELVHLVCSLHFERLTECGQLASLQARDQLEHFRPVHGEGGNGPGWELLKHGRGGGAGGRGGKKKGAAKSGVYRVANKMVRRTQDWRYVVLSASALAELERCRPWWTTESGYYQAVWRARGQRGGPHFLRHSAASDLRLRGAAVAEVQIVLGHWPPGAWRIYAREGWRTPLSIASRLRLPRGAQSSASR